MRLKSMNRLEHIATIDFCYWRLEKLNELISKPKSSIERLVDNACGYNEEEEVKEECIPIMEHIIESKKAIGEDYSVEKKYLDKLKQISIRANYINAHSSAVPS